MTVHIDSNLLAEQMIKILGKDARLIIKCPSKVISLKFQGHD